MFTAEWNWVQSYRTIEDMEPEFCWEEVGFGPRSWGTVMVDVVRNLGMTVL